ncbi:MAG TPA: hypothetical protein VLK55_11315 [Kocuria rosea]|nr:hypothetical protein [Kocuria rosea]
MRLTRTRRRRSALEGFLVLSGRSAPATPAVAARLGLSAGDTGLLEGCLHREALVSVQERSGPVADAGGETFRHRIDHPPVAPPLFTAPDLAERGTTRGRATAHALLQHALAGWQHPQPAPSCRPLL